MSPRTGVDAVGGGLERFFEAPKFFFDRPFWTACFGPPVLDRPFWTTLFGPSVLDRVRFGSPVLERPFWTTRFGPPVLDRPFWTARFEPHVPLSKQHTPPTLHNTQAP